MPPSIYLASQSPRRQALLGQMGQHFELLLPDPSEDVESLEATQAGESPRDYVQRVTALKLASALNRWRLRGLTLHQPTMSLHQSCSCSTAYRQ